MRAMVVTLPAADLARAARFLAALGVAVDGAAADGGRASLAAATVVLVPAASGGGAGRPDGAGGSSGSSRVVARLAAASRQAVDCAFARALVAGGRPWQPLTDDGATYACSFADPDGHVWEVAYAAPDAGDVA